MTDSRKAFCDSRWAYECDGRVTPPFWLRPPRQDGVLAIRSRFVVGLLCLFLLWAAPADAQYRCGGHTIHWVGGAPRASLDFDRGPRHGPPVEPEPEGMTALDRELWDALVFDAYEEPVPNSDHAGYRAGLPLDERHTLVMSTSDAMSFSICIQSADESYTGERLASYSNARWWSNEVQRFTNHRWNGAIKVDACTGEPARGWVYIREGEDGEVDDDVLAHANSWRWPDPHGTRSVHGWAQSEIVWHPDHVRDLTDEYFADTLAHELGHVLGLWHVPPSANFVMSPSTLSNRPDKERWLAQWAHQVGPGVQYPGFVRPTAPEPPGPGSLSDGVKDLVDEALDELNDDSNGRQAAESVPALPAAGVLLLAILLGLLGRRHLRAG